MSSRSDDGCSGGFLEDAVERLPTPETQDPDDGVSFITTLCRQENRYRQRDIDTVVNGEDRHFRLSNLEYGVHSVGVFYSLHPSSDENYIDLQQRHNVTENTNDENGVIYSGEVSVHGDLPLERYGSYADNEMSLGTPLYRGLPVHDQLPSCQSADERYADGFSPLSLGSDETYDDSVHETRRKTVHDASVPTEPQIPNIGQETLIYIREPSEDSLLATTVDTSITTEPQNTENSGVTYTTGYQTASAEGNGGHQHAALQAMQTVAKQDERQPSLHSESTLTSEDNLSPMRMPSPQNRLSRQLSATSQGDREQVEHEDKREESE